uniref:2-oxoglutarate and iron-dependent oxygenase domain-containing protein CP2-like n=1 Tax=Erigeron canadensis TaxID=72917 RepID=UPI001CB96AF0|nr:2-oxoglutarate and iron-dependent oxygenase domain-containing protein CP2-like [Erigeron canadensis]
MSVERRKDSAISSAATAIVPVANGNGLAPSNANYRLRLNPNQDHKADDYDDLGIEFTPLLFSSLERYLPPNLLNVPRDTKYNYMRDILHRYSTDVDRSREQRHKEYRQKIVSNYQPLYKELYKMNSSMFFVPSFLKAFSANDKERDQSIKSIMSEPTPGIYTFDMLQPHFCEMLLSEVENFEKWVHETKFRIMRPNTMNKFGAVLDDFGMEVTLNTLMEDFIRQISKIYFPDVGGYSLDSHHGFVVEYGLDRDLDLGFHVDDSEVTLNVCLGKQFTGGELFFRGVRCEKHVNGETYPEENFDYHHVPGRALIHRGRHRHGARATTSGHRINLLLWCKSSVHRELKKHKKDFLNYCGECKREKKGRLLQFMAARKKELLVGEGEASS